MNLRFLYCVSALPATAIALLMATVIWLSFVSGVPSFPAANYTFNNFVTIFGAPATWEVIANTLVFASISTLVAISGGLILAWIVERTDFPVKQGMYVAVTAILLVPGFFPAMGWLFLLGPRIGILNIWLHDLFGLPIGAISIVNPTGMGVIHGLQTLPLGFIFLGPPMRAISGALTDAGDVHGASLRDRILRIDLPLITPAIWAATIYCFMISIAAFDVPAFIGFTYRVFTFSTYIYQMTTPAGMGLPEYGMPAALSLIVVIPSLLLTALYFQAVKRGRSYQVVTGNAYRTRLQPLSPIARRIIMAGIVAYFLLVLGIPFLFVIWTSVIRYFQPPSLAALELLTWQNFTTAPWALAIRGLGNTLILTVLVPACDIIFGLIIAWIIVRSRSRMRGVLDFVVFAPHAIPHIVLALAMLTLGLFVFGGVVRLVGTVWIIAIVYVLAHLAFVVRTVSICLVQIGSDLEEAALMCGASMPYTMLRIFLPLVANALLNSSIWIALLVFRELTMAVILFTPDNLTLPTVIWSTWYAGQIGISSAMSLVFMALLFPIVLLCLTRQLSPVR